MKNESNFFVQKNIKLVEWSHFACPYDFHTWSNGGHDFAKIRRLKQKWKIRSLSILYWLSVVGAFFFFFSFLATRKKFLNFLLQFLGPNYMLLLLIIIEQNIISTKSSDSRKTLALRISVLNFQVDSLIRSRDIVYTVLKNRFFIKTFKVLVLVFFSEKLI